MICRRQFGVFVDIGYGEGAPGLLLVPEFAEARDRRIDFDEYPKVGDSVEASVIHIDWDRQKITLTQRRSFEADLES